MRKHILKAFAILAAVMLFTSSTGAVFAQYKTQQYKTTNSLEKDLYNDDFASETTTMSEDDMAALMAILGTYMVLLLIISVPLYIYYAISHRKMAEKLHYVHPNWFWVPILNMVALFQMGDENPMYLLLLLLSVIPVVNLIALLVLLFFMVKAYMNIAEKLKFPRWTALLILISPLNLIMYGLWAWGDPKSLFGNNPNNSFENNNATETPSTTQSS